MTTVAEYLQNVKTPQTRKAIQDLLDNFVSSSDCTKFSIGDSTTSASMTTTPYLSLYTTSATTSGTIRSGLVEQTMTGAASANMIEAFKVKVVANVQTGNWCNALMGKIDYSTSGFVTGLAGVVCAELSLPASNAASAGGDYSVYEAEIDCPTSCDMGSRPIIVFEINSWGGAKGEFDDNGYLFDISGVTSGSDHFYYDNTSNAADAFLRCRINGATYYMPLSDSTTFA